MLSPDVPAVTHRKPQAGLSLVELMVAMTLALLLLAGLVQMFVSSKQGYRIQESTSRLQENARYAVNLVERRVHQADYWAGTEASKITLQAGFKHAGLSGGCDATYVFNLDAPVFGYDGGTAPPTPSGCIDASDYVANSDVLVLRYAQPDEFVSSAELLDGDDDEKSGGDAFLRSVVGKSGILFNHAQVAAVGVTAGEEDNGIVTYKYEFAMLFLRPCSVKGGSSTCTGDSDDGDPISTLVVKRLNQSNLYEEPLVDGVEQLQLLYGVDETGDAIVDRYVTATTLGTDEDDWQRVVSVKLGLIVQGDTLDQFTDTNTYAMPGGFDYTPPSDIARKQRRMLVREIQIRNRVRQ